MKAELFFVIGVDPITFTYTKGRVLIDLQEFEDAVNDLRAYDGGDHAEYAFSAMLAALDYSYYDSVYNETFTPMEYNSSMIVITDATSKVPELRGTVINRANEQEVSINFILSGGSSLKSYYEDVANGTGGIIYQDAPTSWSIINFHNELTESESERKRRSAIDDFNSVSVSRFTYALQVSILASTSHGAVSIILPDGSVESADIEDNVIIYLKNKPLPGQYFFSIDEALVEEFLVRQDISLDISLFYLDLNFTSASPTPLTACKFLDRQHI